MFRCREPKSSFLLPVYVFAVNWAIPLVFTATLGLDWIARLLITMALLVPAAFLMGFAFPSGMIRFNGPNRPWFWALNGAAGVLASVLSLSLSMEFGFSHVGIMGACAYAAAWLLILGRRVSEETNR